MSTQIMYSTTDDIPHDELPFITDAEGVIRLCDQCFTSLVERWSFQPNEIHPEKGELCVGCSWRSSGPIQDNISDAIQSLVQARLHGATEDDIMQVLTEVQFFVERERWKDGERALPPTNPSGGVFYRLTHMPRRIVRRLVRGG